MRLEFIAFKPGATINNPDCWLFSIKNTNDTLHVLNFGYTNSYILNPGPNHKDFSLELTKEEQDFIYKCRKESV